MEIVLEEIVVDWLKCFKILIKVSLDYLEMKMLLVELYIVVEDFVEVCKVVVDFVEIDLIVWFLILMVVIECGMGV